MSEIEQERVVESPSLIIQTGSHHTSIEEADALIAKLKHGELNSSTWNPEVALRLEESNDISVIISDGMSPTVLNEKRERFRQPSEFYYILFPDRPKNLNNSGKVHLIGADCTSIYPEFLPDNLANTILSEGRMIHLKDLPQSLDAGILFGITSLLTYSIFEIMKKPEKSEKNQIGMSRRTFLQAMGITAAATGLGTILGYGARDMVISGAERAKNEQIYQLFSKINQFLTPKIFGQDNRWWLDGRTALMIQKGLSIQEMLPPEPGVSEQKAAVIMGSTHLTNSQLFLEDKSARMAAIKKFGDKVIELLQDLLFSENRATEIDQASLILIDYLSRMSDFVFTDPGGPDFQPAVGARISEYFDYQREYTDREIFRVLTT